ncbi:TrmH family RNA methyltransferase [bacterium]|nr:TrmH family RNA methyltransferase [bacterium]
MKFRKLRTHELGRLSSAAFVEAPKHPLTLVLDGVRSAHNLGSVLRTADAFRLNAVHLCGPMPDPLTPEVSKTALGAEHCVEWRRWAHITDCLKALDGYSLLALEMTENAVSLETFESVDERPIALVIGHEISGVSDAALAMCDGALVIPQFGTKHSLNLSVATGIACWSLLFGLGKRPGLLG